MVLLIAIPSVVLLGFLTFLVVDGVRNGLWSISGEDVWATFFATAVSAVVAFVIVLAASLPTNDWERVIDREVDIVAAADTTLTSGSYSIFGGSVGEKPVFFYYRENADGSITQHNVPTSRSSIFEGDYDGELRVTVNRDVRRAEWWRIPAGDRETQYEFYVPEGSVKRDFNYDLGK